MLLLTNVSTMLWNILLTLNKRPTCNFYMSVFYLLRVHDKMHLTTSISPLRRRVPFVMIQKEPKDHLGEGGFRFPPSPKYPFPLKRPIRGAAAPLLDVPPGRDAPRAVFRIGSSVWYPFFVGAHSVRPYESRESDPAGRSGIGPYEGDKTRGAGG